MRSCCLPHFFSFRVSFPRFQKRSPKTRHRFWAREVRPPANFVNYLPPPTPHRHAIAFAPAYSPLQILAMQRQGGKTCSCRCIAQFFPWVFFTANSCVPAHAMHRKNPISVASRPSSTPPLPFYPKNTPPPARPPLPLTTYEGARGAGFVPPLQG